MSPNFEWILYVHSVSVETSTIPSLSLLPRTVCATTDVQMILHAVDDCVIYPVNECGIFAPLVDADNGVLRDASGTLIGIVATYM